MAVFVFLCAGGEGAARVGLLSHPLQLIEGRGQAQKDTHKHACNQIIIGLEYLKLWSLVHINMHIQCVLHAGQMGVIELPDVQAPLF